MYPSRGRGGYGKPPYGSQSGYPQNQLGTAYPGGEEGVSQIPLTSRHPPSVTRNAQDSFEIGGGYRSHLSTAGTHYGPSAYLGRELPNETTARQTDLYDRIDQASLLRGGVRQADYLTERSISALRRSDQEAMHYGRRLGFSDTHGLLRAAPRRNSHDYIYPESSSNLGYGVSLPPGRDYGTGKDERASYLREFELREEERLRENMRDRYKEREREREREREKKRHRHRPKDRERERKHSEASIRRPSSPIRPIRRDYVCKVLSSRLVDMERDYLAVDKRYPRLFVPSEFSKVVANWPKQKLTLPMHTAVSFEHDYTEDGGVDVTYTPTKSVAVKTGGKTVWNAKMILMSGLSRTAREDLASDKIFEDSIPHICNILKFAVLEKEHSFMATGGTWDPTDGMDPSVDQSSLIKTMLRHTKDKLHLDLSNCRHWNPFLEIHYDRVGMDGVSSFKEITVLFVPDLSESLPSFDAWRTQWLAHKKALTERDVIVGKGSNDADEVAKDAEKGESASTTMETKEKSGSPDTEKKEGPSISTKKDNKISEDKKTEKKDDSEIQSESKKVDEKNAKEEINEKGGKDESRIEDKDMKKSEEPPRPGFILQVKRNKDSKFRSLSVSLDSLLDYTAKDIDESSFEVSLFAESLFEMLQYQMGTRILEFLKKLRVKFVRQRNQRKRHQEEISAKQKEAKIQNKRQKTVEHNDKETPAIAESVPEKDDKENPAKETVVNTEDTLGNEETTEAATMGVDNQDEEDDEIDEDPEQGKTDEELQKKEENSATVADPITEVATDRKEEKEGCIMEKTDSKSAEIKPDSESEKHRKQEEGTSDAPKREETVDKELLQAFRFFDRNLTGYVRVEDMRIAIHGLGKFLSHREVKELVQSALLESNTGRDDRILYNKLVRLSL